VHEEKEDDEDAWAKAEAAWEAAERELEAS
jgi:hypothetical protein